MATKLDQGQIMRDIFDAVNQAIRVNVVVGGGGGGSNASVGVNGAVAPASSTEMAGKDASGNLQPILINSQRELVVALGDPTTGAQAAVTAFHNTDNQLFGGTTYGLFTGGVAQLKNVANGLDRQSETGSDNVSALGVSSGAAQLASIIVLSGATVVAGATAITISPASQLKQINNGNNAWIQLGSVFTLEPGTANQEQIVVNTINYSTGALTVTGLGNGGANTGFKSAHTAPYSISSFAYNQAKDATMGDAATAAGMAAGATYLLNAAGTYDRQRETAFDNIPSAGISTGTQQLAFPFTTTIAAAITASASPQIVTPAAMSGTSNGSVFSIQPGHTLKIDTSTNQESVFVISVTATTFTAIFSKSHGINSLVLGFAYNQARDASVPDGSLGTGFSAGATYLFNQQAQGGVGGWERERSASGEQDNASGVGTAVAAEYEFNGITFDRARSLQGKAFSSIVISSGGANGSSSVVIASAPAGLTAGSQIRLFNGTTYEGNWVVATYVSGTTVGLQNPIANGTHTAFQYEAYAVNGPGLNGFLPVGVGIEEEALYDPVTNQYYIERAATQDGVVGANLVMESPGLINGSGTFDRERNASGDSFGTALADGRTPGDRGTESEVSYEYGYNGTSWDRLKSSAGARQIAPATLTFTDRSGTTSATANTSTSVAGVNLNRRYILIQNLDTSNDIFINFTSAASATAPGSIRISAKSSFVLESSAISTEAINIVSGSASINFTAKEG